MAPVSDLPTHKNEQTGNVALDRIQSNVRDLVAFVRNLRAIDRFAVLENRVYVALAANVAIGVTAYAALVSTTITTYLPNGHIDITFTASGANSASAANARFLVLVDGAPVKGTYAYTAAGQTFCGAIVLRVPVRAGKHAVAVQWKSDAGAALIRAASVVEEHAHLLVQEAA